MQICLLCTSSLQFYILSGCLSLHETGSELDNIQTVVREDDQSQRAVLTWVVIKFPDNTVSLSEFMNSDKTSLLI